MTRHGKGPSTSIPVDSSSIRDPNGSTTTTGSSSQDPSSITVDTTQQPTDKQSNESTFAGEIVRQIETLVESFRTGQIKKSETIYRIGQVLADEPTGSKQLKFDSLERYTATLEGIETLAARSNQHGARIMSSTLGKRKEDSRKGNGRHEEFDRSSPTLEQPTDIDDFVQRLSEEHDLEERDNISRRDSRDDSGHESDDELGEQGRSNKKQRIYESQMPWFETEQRIRKSTTNRSCNKTRGILDILQRDPITVKRWIRSASIAPAGFPSTEWDALIKGESVNLDTVFSSLHHIHSIDESIGRVGATEIQFGRPKPVAKVETSGQWTAAFNLVIKATTFLFPHRYDELRQYEDYFEELFSAKSLAVHPKLFKYDEAIRYKVGQGQNILLTDRNQFVRYYEAIVAPDGVGTETASDGNKTSPKKGGKFGEKSNICNRFNGANGCSSSAEKCRYKHICKKCKQRGHGKVECKVDEGM
jgi:hypothetical protein